MRSCCAITSALALCACGDNERPACDAGLSPIRVFVAGEPALLATRVDDGAWETAVETEDNRYDICAATEYQITAACESPSGIMFTYQWSRTTDDPAEVFLGPCPGTVQKPRVPVEATMAQAGAMGLGGGAVFGNTEPWTFRVEAPPGTYDVFASNDYSRPDDEGRVLFRRRVVIDKPTTLAPIDLNVEGSPTVGVALQFDGLAVEDRIGSDVFVWLGESISFISRTARPVARVAPAALLESGDRQSVHVSAGSERSGRFFSRTTTVVLDDTVPDQLPVSLLPPLEGIVFEPGPSTTARWTELPASYSHLTLFEANHTAQYTFATRRWLERHGQSYISLDTDVPGLLPEWLVSESASVGLSLIDDSRSTSVDQNELER